MARWLDATGGVYPAPGDTPGGGAVGLLSAAMAYAFQFSSTSVALAAETVATGMTPVRPRRAAKPIGSSARRARRRVGRCMTTPPCADDAAWSGQLEQRKAALLVMTPST